MTVMYGGTKHPPDGVTAPVPVIPNARTANTNFEEKEERE
jgi:hypothetical protein